MTYSGFHFVSVLYQLLGYGFCGGYYVTTIGSRYDGLHGSTYLCMFVYFSYCLFVLANELDRGNEDEKIARALPKTFSLITYQPILH